MHEKIEVYEALLHDLYFNATVAMRPEKVQEALGRIGNWSYAHRQGNGEFSEKEQQDHVNYHFWKLKGPL